MTVTPHTFNTQSNHATSLILCTVRRNMEQAPYTVLPTRRKSSCPSVHGGLTWLWPELAAWVSVLVGSSLGFQLCRYWTFSPMASAPALKVSSWPSWVVLEVRAAYLDRDTLPPTFPSMLDELVQSSACRHGGWKQGHHLSPWQHSPHTDSRGGRGWGSRGKNAKPGNPLSLLRILNRFSENFIGWISFQIQFPLMWNWLVGEWMTSSSLKRRVAYSGFLHSPISLSSKVHCTVTTSLAKISSIYWARSNYRFVL